MQENDPRPGAEKTPAPGETGGAGQGEEGAVENDPAFKEWREGLPSFELDDERLFLPTGDIPMDESQLVDYWRRLKASEPRE